MTQQEVSPKRHRNSRHLARVFALLGVYQWFVDPTQDYAAIEAHLSELVNEEGEAFEGGEVLLSEFTQADKAFFRELLAGVLDRQAEIGKIVAEHVDRDLSRVSMVERSVLYLGTFELLNNLETPYRVVLNESVELAKSFGSGNRYTNAVLANIARAVRPEETQQA